MSEPVRCDGQPSEDAAIFRSGERLQELCLAGVFLSLEAGLRCTLTIKYRQSPTADKNDKTVKKENKMKTCKWSTDIGWHRVAILGSRRDWAIELGHQDNPPPESFPWCIHWGGAGHYFPTCREAIDYAAKRWGKKIKEKGAKFYDSGQYPRDS